MRIDAIVLADAVKINDNGEIVITNLGPSVRGVPSLPGRYGITVVIVFTVPWGDRDDPFTLAVTVTNTDGIPILENEHIYTGKVAMHPLTPDGAEITTAIAPVLVFGFPAPGTYKIIVHTPDRSASAEREFYCVLGGA